MLKIRDSQMEALSTASGRPAVHPCKATWIEFQLVDQDGNPVPGVSYKVGLPDGSLLTGSLDAQGSVRFEPIVAGKCKISFPEIDASEWHRA